MLKDRKARTFPSVLHILGMDRTLIYIRKISDVGVNIIFEKEMCRMVQGSVVLLRGFWTRKLSELLGSIANDGCRNSIFLGGGDEEV